MPAMGGNSNQNPTTQDRDTNRSTTIHDALEDKLNGLEFRIDWAYDQIHVLYNQLEGLRKRYNRACKDGRRSFRYHIRLRIITCEGMINTFYEYACLKEAEAKKLRITIYGDVIDDSSSEEEEEEERE